MNLSIHHMKSIALLIPLFLTAMPSAFAHDHFAAGIIDANANGQPDAGESLRFSIGDPEARIFHLLARPVGQRCGGSYMIDESARTLFPTDAFSIIAESDGQYDLEGTHHAHTGSWIWAEIVSVTGPEGGTFGFWEENSSTVTHALPVNQPTGNPAFVISEGIDDPGDDPGGHIHGRAWTASLPGEYLVGIRLVDHSTSGPSGGPWHAPSRVYQFHFSAGPSFQPELARTANGGVTLSWPSRMGVWQAGGQTGVVFRVMRGTSPAAAAWQQIGSVTGTTADSISFTDPVPPSQKAFYRLEYSWSND